jgi:hypothetical protein
MAVFYFLPPFEMETTLLRHKAIEAKILLRSALIDPEVLMEVIQVPQTPLKIGRLWVRNNRYCSHCNQRWTLCELPKHQIKRLIRILKAGAKELR